MQQFRTALAIHEGRLEDDKWHQDMSESKLMSLQFLLAIGINITRFWMILIYVIHATINSVDTTSVEHASPHGARNLKKTRDLQKELQLFNNKKHYATMSPWPKNNFSAPKNVFPTWTTTFQELGHFPQTLQSRRDPSSAQRRGSPPVRLLLHLFYTHLQVMMHGNCMIMSFPSPVIGDSKPVPMNQEILTEKN